MNTKRNKNILFVGFGDLAYKILNILYLDESNYNFYILCRNEKVTLEKINLIKFTGGNLNKYKNIKIFESDLFDTNKTIDVIDSIEIDLLINTASIQSWKELTKLPKKIFNELDKAQLGPWLPLHLSPVLKLMEAIKKSTYKGPVINAAYPDAVNPILNTIGLSPTCGIGNCANIIPALKYSISESLNIDVNKINIKLVAHHFLSHHAPRFGNTGNAPYKCWLTVDGLYENKEIILDDIILKPLTTKLKRTGGILGQQLTASSAITVIYGFLSNKCISAHSPGVNGLVGGYPVVFNNGQISIDLPSDFSINEAESINLSCQKLDGIKSIEKNGTVNFTDEHMSIMNDFLSFNCKSFNLDDVHEVANELRTKFLNFTNLI